MSNVETTQADEMMAIYDANLFSLTSIEWVERELRERKRLTEWRLRQEVELRRVIGLWLEWVKL